MTRRLTTIERCAPCSPAITRVAERDDDRAIFLTSNSTVSSGIPIKDAAISACASRSSVMPIAAKMASSSVGGSRRTRRGPYLVFQSSLIEASPLIPPYLGPLMLHCNMYLGWQSSHALQFFQPCGVVDFQRRRG